MLLLLATFALALSLFLPQNPAHRLAVRVYEQAAVLVLATGLVAQAAPAFACKGPETLFSDDFHDDAGGWALYREESSRFAYSSGYLNSYWHLGFVNAPMRYSVKEGMALLWTFGPGLVFAPLGVARLWRRPNGGKTLALLVLSVVPALGSHLLVHFGVPGYAFHCVPALLALIVLGLIPADATEPAAERRGVIRLAALSAILAACFLFYPTNYDVPGFRGDFDLAFARHTRVGLRTPTPVREPSLWRTPNSLKPRGTPGESVKELVDEEMSKR